MLTHIVLFRFADRSDAQEAASRLCAMSGRIPGLLDVAAGVDITHSERSYDLGLITHHADADALAQYQVHPVHQEVVAFIRTRSTAAAAVDFISE